MSRQSNTDGMMTFPSIGVDVTCPNNTFAMEHKIKLKELTDEILGLAEWADSYAETLPEEPRTKLADVSVYLSILSRLIQISDPETLDTIQI